MVRHYATWQQASWLGWQQLGNRHLGSSGPQPQQQFIIWKEVASRPVRAEQYWQAWNWLGHRTLWNWKMSRDFHVSEEKHISSTRWSSQLEIRSNPDINPFGGLRQQGNVAMVSKKIFFSFPICLSPLTPITNYHLWRLFPDDLVRGTLPGYGRRHFSLAVLFGYK